MQAEKERFEKEREKTLNALPESIKNMFGQIGFAPSEHDDDDFVPVLVVSPYSVPPKPVRDIYWFDFFNRAKRTKSLDKLAYLVYHYGHDDPDDCYSFIDQNDFVPYQEGKEKGYHNMHLALVGKENMTQEEEIQVRGIREMDEDVEKEPADRMRGVVDFMESYEIYKDAPPPAKRQKK